MHKWYNKDGFSFFQSVQCSFHFFSDGYKSCFPQAKGELVYVGAILSLLINESVHTFWLFLFAYVKWCCLGSLYNIMLMMVSVLLKVSFWVTMLSAGLCHVHVCCSFHPVFHVLRLSMKQFTTLAIRVSLLQKFCIYSIWVNYINLLTAMWDIIVVT